MTKKKCAEFDAEMLDKLLEGQDPSTVLRSDGLLGELKTALAQRMLNAEMDVHLSTESEQEARGQNAGQKGSEPFLSILCCPSHPTD